ncbi:hypothetical protein Ahia01_000780800 [Argonauta hians]
MQEINNPESIGTPTILIKAMLGSELAVMSLPSDHKLAEPGDEADETSLNTTIDQGKDLLSSFICNRIKNEGMEVPPEINSANYSRTDEAKAMGRELQLLADQFALSNERKEVRNKAQSSRLVFNNYDEFAELLESLFNPGGITRSRIIVLFFFCSDLAIRTLKECANFFSKFLTWFFKFLSRKICYWVERNGGWFAVLHSEPRYKYLIVTLVICASAIFVYKWVRR